MPKSWSVLGKVLGATVRAGPARDELDPENAARDAGVDGGARLRSVLRVQARSAVPVQPIKHRLGGEQPMGRRHLMRSCRGSQ
jgi:hypothetical protein